LLDTAVTPDSSAIKFSHCKIAIRKARKLANRLTPEQRREHFNGAMTMMAFNEADLSPVHPVHPKRLLRVLR